MSVSVNKKYINQKYITTICKSINQFEKEENYKSISSYSLDDLKYYHREATDFFITELLMLKEVIPKIIDDRQTKAAMLLISCTQTGAAILQLANQTDRFTTESIMLSRVSWKK